MVLKQWIKRYQSDAVDLLKKYGYELNDLSIDFYQIFFSINALKGLEFSLICFTGINRD